MSGKRLVYGVNPVRELVGSRAGDVAVVYFSPRLLGGAAVELRRSCTDRRIAIEEREPKELDELVGAEARHQGVVAVAGEFPYAELEDLLDRLEGGPPALFVVLDGVQDPHNLGAIIRSAAVLGSGGVIIGRDRAAPVTPAAVKASAGATERVPVAQVTNLVRALETMKERGIWTVGAVSRQQPAPAPWQVDLAGPIALVLGSEGKGLRRLVDETCDLHVQIPMPGISLSLNVSVAAGVLLAEAVRQRSVQRSG